MLQIMIWMNLALWTYLAIHYLVVVLIDKRRQRVTASMDETWNQHVDEALSLQE